MTKKTTELVEARMKETFDPVFNPTKPKPFYKTCGFTLTLAVFVASSIATIIFWGTDIWNITTLKIVTLKDGGLIFNHWRRPECDTVIKIYPFNYTNIDRLRTERPHVEEIGPYVFRERVEKVNIVFNHDGRTLTFSENRTHEFDEFASIGSLDDIIFTPNVPFISAANSGASRNIISQLGLAAILKGLDTRPFLPVDLERFVMGFDDSFSLVARKLSSILKGHEVPKFGLLNSRVGVSRERVTIGTGIPDLETLGTVYSYDGEQVLNYWDSDECNSISGSDGSIFPGKIVQAKSKLYLYAKGFCRRIPLVFYGERVMAQDFPAKRYELPHNIYDLPSENPENECFCKETQCSPKGTFRTSICNFGAPMYVSFPHFLYGDPILRTNVTGLHPDESKHRFYWDLHETLGLPLSFNTRFQVSVLVKHCPFLYELNTIPSNTLLPIAWIDIELGKLTDNMENLLYHATYTSAYCNVAASWLSLILFFASTTRLFCYFCKS